MSSGVSKPLILDKKITLSSSLFGNRDDFHTTPWTSLWPFQSSSFQTWRTRKKSRIPFWDFLRIHKLTCEI